MHEHDYGVIMAGGGGTRLWPLSRQARPKQMLRLGGERTLFQLAVDRLKRLLPPERILVVTVAAQAHELQEQCPEIPGENYLIEPMPRGTASVVGLAAVVLHRRDPLARMAVVTADHFIQNVGSFCDLLAAALAAAGQDYLVTLGITPTHPATGYGYIQRGRRLADQDGHAVYEVLRFKEKPSEEVARSLLAGGDHDWNSGMFIWKVTRILGEFERWMPDLYERLQQIAATVDTPAYAERVQAVWPTIRPETIDYGIMEKAERIAVLPAGDLGWSDVGSWDSLFEVLPLNEKGNIILGARHLDLDTHASLVCSEDAGRLIVTLGVQDLIVVDTGDAVLICSRDRAQLVRQLVGQLKDAGLGQYL